jgi:3-hydroxybutyryl-CoA dehydrogenase
MAELKTIGVIGAGQMGSGIAQVLATAGFKVRLNDVEPARIDKAIASIAAGLERLAAKGKLEDAPGSLKRIAPAADVDALKDCDLVVEAAAEDEAVKRAIYDSLKGRLKAEAFLASNTSSLSITRLAASTDRPERFIGLHFMNPVPVMKLVELIRGIQTSDETFAMAAGLVETLGKQAAVSEDYPAFIVNRILMPMINEACYALYEGVGTVASIDMAMKLGANHPMGPLELADFIGLDTCLSIMRVLYDELADSKYRPCPLLVKYVEAGWLGRKTGRGFYDYRGPEPVPTR